MEKPWLENLKNHYKKWNYYPMYLMNKDAKNP